MGSRTANRQARREQILDAACAEFSARGYHATQVSDIVARAGIARGTFYYNYEGKRQVFEALLDSTLALIDTNLGVIDPTRPARPQVLGNITALVRLLIDNVDLARILLHVAVGMDLETDERLARFWGRLISRIEQTVEEGQRIGFLRPGDARVMAVFLVGTVKEATTQYLAGNLSRSVGVLIRETIRCALDGLAADPVGLNR